MNYNISNKSPEILIVDDSPDHIQFVASILKNMNYKIRAITKPTHILEAFKRGVPDLILLDVLMPEMNGFEACAMLKKDPRYSGIPIIFLTAVNDSENIVKGFEAGAQDYVSKPVNPKELIARIETHLSLKNHTDKLVEAYHDIENFNHMVSHDIKAPIWSINKLVVFLKNAIAGGNTEDIQELMDIILEKTSETALLIEKYTELVKLSGKSIELSVVDMNDLADTVIEEIVKARPDQKIEFSRSELAIVKGDKLLLEQVLRNIFSNAAKYSQNKEISRIEINCEREGNAYLFTVKDNGVGFDMKFAENIFKFFVRLHSKNEFEGSGIGLAIVKKIIALHEGRVWITASVDEGATVYFTLPAET